MSCMLLWLQADQLHYDARPQQWQEAHGCELLLLWSLRQLQHGHVLPYAGVCSKQLCAWQLAPAHIAAGALDDLH